MQRQYYYNKNTSNEKGFLFPYTAFIAALLLLATVTSITILENNRKMTTYQMEQIEMETLRQMATSSLEKDLKKGEMLLPFSSKNYTFPHGETIILYQSHTENILYVSIKTITKHNSEKLWLISIALTPDTSPKLEIH